MTISHTLPEVVRRETSTGPPTLSCASHATISGGSGKKSAKHSGLASSAKPGACQELCNTNKMLPFGRARYSTRAIRSAPILSPRMPRALGIASREAETNSPPAVATEWRMPSARPCGKSDTLFILSFSQQRVETVERLGLQARRQGFRTALLRVEYSAAPEA
jgi:hypothetical protein